MQWVRDRGSWGVFSYILKQHMDRPASTLMNPISSPENTRKAIAYRELPDACYARVIATWSTRMSTSRQNSGQQS